MKIEEMETLLCICGIIIILIYAMNIDLSDNQIVLIGLGILGGYLGKGTVNKIGELGA